MSRLIVLLVLMTAGACTQEEKEPSVEPPPKWQETSHSKPVEPSYEDLDFELEVGSPRPCEVKGPMAPGDGVRRISVPVEVTSKTNREVPVGPLLFTLEDQEGHRFRPTLAGCAPSMPQKRLKDRASLKGEVAFDVPKDTDKLEITFEPFLIGRKKVIARALVPSETPGLPSPASP